MFPSTITMLLELLYSVLYGVKHRIRNTIVTLHGKHNSSNYGVKDLLKVDECDTKWRLVIFKSLNDPSKDVYLLHTVRLGRKSA